MKKKVIKFGGTSVGSIERIMHAAKIIQEESNKGNKLIVVVSAMAGKTSELISMSKQISNKYSQVLKFRVFALYFQDLLLQ